MTAKQQQKAAGDVDISGRYNGVGDAAAEVGADREVTEATKDDPPNGQDGDQSCNGVDHLDDSETRLTEDPDESLLVPVPTSSSGRSAVRKASDQARFARDAMDKLDALCRSQEHRVRECHDILNMQRGWAKQVTHRSLHVTLSNTGRFSKFAMKRSVNIPPHFKHVAIHYPIYRIFSIFSKV